MSVDVVEFVVEDVVLLVPETVLVTFPVVFVVPVGVPEVPVVVVLDEVVELDDAASVRVI